MKPKYKKPNGRIYFVICALCVVSIWILMFSSGVLGENNNPDIENNPIIILPTVALMITILLFIRAKSNYKRYVKEITKKENEGKYSAYISGSIKHFDGLPMAKGVMVNVFMSESEIVFTKDGQEVSLNRNKILSADVVSGDDAKREVMTGAIAGNIISNGSPLFTGIGAILAKSIYFVITYKNDDEVKYIMFDTDGSKLPYRKIADDLRINNSSTKERIEL